MKYTLEELSSKTNTELDEICAIALSFEHGTLPLDWYDSGTDTYYDFYSPTTNKEQAWDLMIKYGLPPMKDDESYDVLVVFPDSSVYVSNHDPLVAVTIAAILAAQENK